MLLLVSTGAGTASPDRGVGEVALILGALVEDTALRLSQRKLRSLLGLTIRFLPLLRDAYLLLHAQGEGLRPPAGGG